MKRAWAGIDVGTQSVKVQIVDDNGVPVGIGSSPLTSHRERNQGQQHHQEEQNRRHTQSPAQWLSATGAALAAAMRAVRDSSEHWIVSGVSVTATSGTIVVLDSDGHPASAGVMYDDDRGAACGAEVRERGRALWDRLGYPMADSWALPKIRALLGPGSESGSEWGARHTVAQQADVVTAWLAGGPVASDASHTLKSGYDVVAMAWPTDVFAALGLDAAQFPRVVASGTVIGGVCESVAETTGLPAGVPIVAGMTDGCCSQIGSGDVHRGAWTSTIGTTLVLKGVSGSRIGDRSGGVYSHAAPFPGWLVGGASNVGANAISALLPGANLASLQQRLPPVADVPLLYPLLQPGERFPFASDAARGFFVAPDGAERPLDALRADPAVLFAGVMLGIALIERLCVDTMRALGASAEGTVSLGGGATANRWWNQLRSDVLGLPTRVPRFEGAARGAAIIAACAIDGRLTELPDVAERMSATAARYEPAPGRAGLLGDRYAEMVRRLRERGYLR